MSETTRDKYDHLAWVRWGRKVLLASLALSTSPASRSTTPIISLAWFFSFADPSSLTRIRSMNLCARGKSYCMMRSWAFSRRSGDGRSCRVGGWLQGVCYNGCRFLDFRACSTHFECRDQGYERMSYLSTHWNASNVCSDLFLKLLHNTCKQLRPPYSELSSAVYPKALMSAIFSPFRRGYRHLVCTIWLRTLAFHADIF